jgi:CheY-like chemotaxis protein
MAVRAVARATLETLGYRVLEASEGQEAVTVLESRGSKVDLLITDVVMPGMNAVELIRLARIIRPGIRVLCISGYAEQAVYHQALVGGGTPFLQKPFTPQALARKVRELLDRAEDPVPNRTTS